MLFFLATPEYTQVQSNTVKIKVHLSSGVAEIYEQHQDLIGKIGNDLLEIETLIDNKSEKTKYVVQEGIFIVSTKNTIAVEALTTETGIYIYAKRAKEVSSKSSLDEVLKEYEIKKERFEKEEQRLAESSGTSDSANAGKTLLPKNSKLALLKEEVDFLKKVIVVIKELKA